jgi:hypothetical protein
MKNGQIICITSLAKRTRVTIQNGRRKLRTAYFNGIAEAINFVLPRGDRRTSLYLNGNMATLHGWWE